MRAARSAAELTAEELREQVCDEDRRCRRILQKARHKAGQKAREEKDVQRVRELTLCLEHEGIQVSAGSDSTYIAAACSDAGDRVFDHVVDHVVDRVVDHVDHQIQQDENHRNDIAVHRVTGCSVQTRVEEGPESEPVSPGMYREGRSEIRKAARMRPRSMDGVRDVMHEIRRALGMADRLGRRGKIVSEALSLPETHYPETEFPNQLPESPPDVSVPSAASSCVVSHEKLEALQVDWRTSTHQVRGETVSLGDRELDALLGGGLLCGALHEFQGCESPFACGSDRVCRGNAGVKVASSMTSPASCHSCTLPSEACEVPFGAILHVVRCAAQHPSLANRPVIWIGDRVCPPCTALHPALMSRCVDQGCNLAGKMESYGWMSLDLSTSSIAVSDRVAVHFVSAFRSRMRPRQTGRESSRRTSRHQPSAEGAASPASIRAWCAERALRLAAAGILVVDAAGMDVSSWRRLQLAASACASPVLVLMVSGGVGSQMPIAERRLGRENQVNGIRGKANPSATCWRVGGEIVASVEMSKLENAGSRFGVAPKECSNTPHFLDTYEIFDACASPGMRPVRMIGALARRWTISLQALRGRAAVHASRFGIGGVHQAMDAGVAIMVEEDVVGGRACAASVMHISPRYDAAKIAMQIANGDATGDATGDGADVAMGAAAEIAMDCDESSMVHAVGHACDMWSTESLSEAHDFVAIHELSQRSRQSVA